MKEPLRSPSTAAASSSSTQGKDHFGRRLARLRELGEALALTATTASILAKRRRGRNIRHRLLGLLRQAVYGRLAGYEDVYDAERLARVLEEDGYRRE